MASDGEIRNNSHGWCLSGAGVDSMALAHEQNIFKKYIPQKVNTTKNTCLQASTAWLRSTCDRKAVKNRATAALPHVNTERKQQRNNYVPKEACWSIPPMSIFDGTETHNQPPESHLHVCTHGWGQTTRHYRQEQITSSLHASNTGSNSIDCTLLRLSLHSWTALSPDCRSTVALHSPSINI